MIELTLPVEDQNKIIVSNNEFINNSTINRGHLRLLLNDKQLRDWIEYLSGEVMSLDTAVDFLLSLGTGNTGSTIIVSGGMVVSGSNTGNVNAYSIYQSNNLVTFHGSGNGPSAWIEDSGFSVDDLLYASTYRTQVVHTVGSPYTITTIDDNRKVFVDESLTTFTYNLPVAAEGLSYTFVKNTAATLVIKAQPAEKIADSSVGGTLYNNTTTEVYATVTLLAIKTGTTAKWVVEGAHGTWVTS